MNQMIQHIAPNVSTTAVSTADSGALDDVGGQSQQTDFSGLLSDSMPSSNMLERLRETLTEDEYLALESWLSGGEILPLQEEFAGEIVPFLIGNIDLLPPQIGERIQQLAFRLRGGGELPESLKSWQELKGLLQPLAFQPGNSKANATEGELFEAGNVQINAQNPSLSPIPAALGRSIAEEGPAGLFNALSSMMSTGAETARSLPVIPGGLTASGQPAAGLLGVPLGEPGWNQALGRQIHWMVGSEIQSASLKITPPQLGPIEINLSVKNDQANILFAAQHAQVREVLEAAIPRLREMFGEINLNLVNVDVEKREEGQHHFSALLSDQDEKEDQKAAGYSDARASANAGDNGDSTSIRSSGLVDDYA